MKKFIALLLIILTLSSCLFGLTAYCESEDDESEDRITDVDGEVTVNIDDPDGY